jgi:Methyltransferase domain/galactosyl transferase GMA12/MNN10 family
MHCLHRDQLGQFLNDAGLTGSGVEVGSAAGRFAATILGSWQGRQLALVDPWESQATQEYLDVANLGTDGQATHLAMVRRLADADRRVRLVRGLSPAVADRFEDGSLDFVYLDGNHSYLAVQEDLRAWYPKVRPGALFAGHDYLDGIVGNCLFGVKTAVDEFARELGLAVAFTTADPPFRTWLLRKPLGPRPSPERVTVLTAYDAGFRELGELSRANKEAYCLRHGYRFVCRTDGFEPDRPPAWSKLRFALAELDRADWVFWTDADSLVMNSAVPLTCFLQDAVDLVLSADPYQSGVNTGCFFVRSTAWSRRFLERVYEQTAFLHHPWWENAALVELYRQDPDVRRHAAVVPNKLFNAYPFEGGGYAAGDFLIHFPGLKDREAAMRNYAAMAR